MNRRIIIAAALVVFFLALIADAALGNTIYMPSVSRNKAEPTIEAGATPWVSDPPWIAPTATPTQEPQP